MDRSSVAGLMPDQLESWEGRSVLDWRKKWAVPELRIFGTVTSTNDVLRQLADEGAPAGTVVLADVQEQGRGRRGDRWVSTPGKGLLLSVLLRPSHVSNLGPVPLRVGLAVIRAIDGSAGIEARLKWPNDLLVGNRKIAGVLCEASYSRRDPSIVVGVGINVLQGVDDWPEDLRRTAGSVLTVTGKSRPRPPIAEALIREIVKLSACGVGELEPWVLSEINRRDALRGRLVCVDGRRVGTAAGIEADGTLLVRDERGCLRRFLNGSVRVCA